MESLNNKFYSKAYKKYGVCAQGVHWSSQKTQYIRFNVLTSFIEKDIENSSILDIGCGFAEYLNFLQIKELKAKEYLGIDCEEFMIKESKKRFSEYQFLQIDILKDILPKKDYLLCSGALNILKKEEFFKAIEKCYKTSQKGFIFNFLTKETFNNLQKQEVILFCQNIAKKVTISKVYLPNDITLFLEK